MGLNHEARHLRDLRRKLQEVVLGSEFDHIRGASVSLHEKAVVPAVRRSFLVALGSK